MMMITLPLLENQLLDMQVEKTAYSNLYSLPSTIRIIKLRMGWVGNVAPMEGKRNAYMLLDGMQEGKGSLGRPRCRLR
jgi:hypothetical protein